MEKDIYVAGSKNHVFLNKLIDSPNIKVGDYTFYHDFVDPTRFESLNAGYFVKGEKVKLTIGKYCSLADGIQFISSLANHPIDGFSGYPFPWVLGEETGYEYVYPDKGDTLVGNDVWIGAKATILPGVTIGDGAVIGAGAMVTKDVPPYTVVGGNPARLIRVRFPDGVVDQLLQLRWWDWPVEMVIRHSRAIAHGDMDELVAAAKEL
ncbi:MAG: Virginiamycin A acetyltransferase [Chlamydiia bacterium]|nr:Virginiamycin A acetyltransferase [Chlamydiia bacterium]